MARVHKLLLNKSSYVEGRGGEKGSLQITLMRIRRRAEIREIASVSFWLHQAIPCLHRVTRRRYTLLQRRSAKENLTGDDGNICR